MEKEKKNKQEKREEEKERRGPDVCLVVACWAGRGRVGESDR